MNSISSMYAATVDNGCLFAVMLGMKMPPPIADQMLLSITTGSMDSGQPNDSMAVPGTPGKTCAVTAGMAPTKQLSPKIATVAESPGNYVGTIHLT